jgi:2-iminoacetate synthase
MLARETISGLKLDGIEHLTQRILFETPPISRRESAEILDRISPVNPLSPFVAAGFFKAEDPEIFERFTRRAKEIKERVFGKRVVLFAPLYMSSRCHNNCLYCSFRKDNRSIKRITLSPEEATDEALLLQTRGYKRLLLVCGEGSIMDQAEYITGIMRSIYEKTDIRILHVNAAPMAVPDLRKIKEAGAGVYQVFQETYHRETYAEMHPLGRKADYSWRLSCMDRAIEAGFDDLGIGALLGLYDWKFDSIATILHSIYLRERYGYWPHTLSVPRFKAAMGAEIENPPCPVSDEDFLKIVSAYRLCVPSAGVVVSTREPGWLREKAVHAGASQISAGSNTAPGGYGKSDYPEKNGQFTIDDSRSLNEMIEVLIDGSLIPSLCTSCYRSKRTGQRFMEMAASGKMDEFCHANALLSLAEHAREMDDRKLAEKCFSLIREEAALTDPLLKEKFQKKLLRVMVGKKDERF